MKWGAEIDPIYMCIGLNDVGCYNATICFMSKYPTLYLGKQESRKFPLLYSQINISSRHCVLQIVFRFTSNVKKYFCISNHVSN